MQQFAYTKGKNSTDSAFIIDAMDLLYAGNVDGFCIVSSDSDFTRLATRLREAGKTVLGLGERKAPEAFIAACDRFVFLEVLKKPTEASARVQVYGIPDLKELLSSALEATARDSGWARTGRFGVYASACSDAPLAVPGSEPQVGDVELGLPKSILCRTLTSNTG